MSKVAQGNPARWWRSRFSGSASLAPHTLLVGPVRRWLGRVALILLVLLLWGGWYITSPARISRLSAALLSRVLGGNVTVHNGRLSMSGTLLLSGVEVRSAGTQPGDDIPIFTAEQIEARFDWLSLISGQLSATQLVATTPVFQAIEDPRTGRWNYERLRPDFGGPPRPDAPPGVSLPVIVLRDAHVRWGEWRDGQIVPTGQTIIEGDMTPDSGLSSTYHFRFAQLPSTSPDQNPERAVLRGVWDSATSVFKATTENLVMSDPLRQGLPRAARQWCADHHLAGRLSRLDFSFNPRTGLALTVSFDGVSMVWMVEPEQGIGMGEERPAYPLDVRNVRGQVVFSRDDRDGQPSDLIQVRDLRGEVLGYDFRADGKILGTSREAPFSFDLEFPGAMVGESYPPLFMAFNASQDLMQRMAPHGRMDIFVNLHRDTARGPVKYDGRVELHDAFLRYAHFPMPMDHVNGRITFDDRTVTFHDLTAKADQIDVRLTGSCGAVWSNRLVDITVSSPNILLDDRLAACLPAEYQDIWDLFAMRGSGSFVCRITRADSLMDPQKITVDVDLANMQGYLRGFPYPFTQGAGRLRLGAEETRIERFSARTGVDGTGNVTIDGVVRQVGADASNLQPELTVKADVPVDQRLFQAFPETFTARLPEMTAGGRLLYEGMVRRAGAPGAEAVQVEGALAWKQGSLELRLGDQPLVLKSVSAQATVTPASIDLKSLTADLPLETATLQAALAGKLDIETWAGLMRVTFTGRDLKLPGELPPIAPASWREQWKRLAPSGFIDVTAETALRINLPGNPAATQPAVRLSDAIMLDTYTARLTLRDAALDAADWPDALTGVSGKLEFVPGRITMTGIKAALGDIALSWSGLYQPDSGRITLAGEAVSPGYPTAWMHYLPDAIRDNLDMKRSDVSLTLRLDTLSREAESKPWVMEGRLQAANIAGAGSVPLITVQRTDFTGKAVFVPQTASFDFSGALTAESLAVSDRLIENLTANIVVASERHEITISEVDGQVAGGVLQGSIHIRTAGALPGQTDATQPGTLPADMRDGGYIANLVLSDAQLASLVLSPSADEQDRKTIGTGRVTASLSLQQTFGANADRTGRGDLIVRDGDIYNVPLAMGLMQVATLRLPVARSFQQATMSYYLRDNEITFERILLESQGINLAGLGTVSLSDRQMNMSFVTESPNEMSIPILTPIIRGTRDGLLMQLSVTGTLDEPKITPVPLSAISGLLRAILPRPRADARR